MSDDQPTENTDRELWRDGDDAYADSIHVTELGGIGINVGGYVIVRSLRDWHQLALAQLPAMNDGDRLRKLATTLSEEYRSLLEGIADEIQARAGQ